jgi:transcription-repair coupling factor (superfamily II helicase)
VRRLRSEYEEALPEAEGFAEASMPLSASIDLPIPSVIPPDYVPDRDLRLQLYRRLAEIRSESELRTLESELEDRFGAPPPEVGNLLYQLRARIIAADAQVISVSTEGGQVLIQLPPEWDRERLRELEPEVRVSRRGLWINRSREDPWREHLIRVLESLRDLNKVEAPLAPRLDPG